MDSPAHMIEGKRTCDQILMKELVRYTYTASVADSSRIIIARLHAVPCFPLSMFVSCFTCFCCMSMSLS